MKKLSIGQSVAGFLIGLLVLAIVGLAGYGGYVLVKDNLIKDNKPGESEEQKPENNTDTPTTPEEEIAATAVAETWQTDKNNLLRLFVIELTA